MQQLQYGELAKISGLVLLVILFDQISKLTVQLFSPGLVVFNKNGVFGIVPWWFGAVGAVILGGYLVKSYRCGGQDWYNLVLWVIWAAGVSNLIDRLVHGGVVDFISIWQFPVFNLADMFISVGAGALIVKELLVKKNCCE